MKAYQTTDGFFRAACAGSPKRRTMREAKADADMIEPLREFDRQDKIVLRAVVFIIATLVVVYLRHIKVLP